MSDIMSIIEKEVRSVCIIISGGEYDIIPEVQPGDYVIACDKGYEYAKRSGIRPDIVIADFDSYDGSVDITIPVLKYPCEKDDTDTMAAVKYAVAKGFSDIVLCCAQGGRTDHALANIQSCAYAADRGIKVTICSSDNEIRFLKDDFTEIEKKEGFSLSVFSFTDRSEGVDILGAKYEICNATVTNSFPLGVSNEWREDIVKIAVKSGILMIVTSKK
jgi:thiamine pyrophosphokinase